MAGEPRPVREDQAPLGTSPPGACLLYSGSRPPAHPSLAHHVLLHPARPRWVVVNGTSLEIARDLIAGSSVEEAARRLASRYGISEARARADAAYVAGRLNAEGFLGEDVHHPDRRIPRLETVFLHLTDRCNLSCPHCYALPSGRGTATDDIPTEVALRLVDEVADLGGRGITLSGGEALLHPGVRAILRRAAGRGLEIRLLTNGTLLDPEWAAFLADLAVSVQVSIDGSREEIHDRVRGAGSFHRALRGVALLQEAGFGARITVCATVMRGNVDDLPGIVMLAERLGVPAVRFLPLRREGRAREAWACVGEGLRVPDVERFYRLTAGWQREGKTSVSVSCGLSGFVLKFPEDAGDEIWCPVGRTLDVRADGSVYPCVLMEDPRFLLGNAHRESLSSMLRSSAMRVTCDAFVGRRTRIARCAGCPWRNLCQAGCMGQALDNRGTIEDVDDFCEYRQRAYEEAFDRILALESGSAR